MEDINNRLINSEKMDKSIIKQYRVKFIQIDKSCCEIDLDLTYNNIENLMNLMQDNKAYLIKSERDSIIINLKFVQRIEFALINTKNEN